MTNGNNLFAFINTDNVNDLDNQANLNTDNQESTVDINEKTAPTVRMNKDEKKNLSDPIEVAKAAAAKNLNTAATMIKDLDTAQAKTMVATAASTLEAKIFGGKLAVSSGVWLAKMAMKGTVLVMKWMGLGLIVAFKGLVGARDQLNTEADHLVK